MPTLPLLFNPSSIHAWVLVHKRTQRDDCTQLFLPQPRAQPRQRPPPHRFLARGRVCAERRVNKVRGVKGDAAHAPVHAHKVLGHAVERRHGCRCRRSRRPRGRSDGTHTVVVQQGRVDPGLGGHGEERVFGEGRVEGRVPLAHALRQRVGRAGEGVGGEGNDQGNLDGTKGT
jgi:hypothetical protein